MAGCSGGGIHREIRAAISSATRFAEARVLIQALDEKEVRIIEFGLEYV
jgi:hypothetical protein